MTTEPPVQRVTILDEDHVMRLVLCLLRWSNTDDTAYSRDFFDPEKVPLDALAAVGHPLRSTFRLDVRQAEGTGADAVAGSDVILLRRGAVTAAMIDACPDLRLIQRLGQSPLGIDLEAPRRRGVQVSCLPRGSLVHVAEHVFLLMLSLARLLLPSVAAIRDDRRDAGAPGQVSYNWTGLSGFSTLAGRTLGIVGLGEIGALVTARAKAFGMHVVYTRRTRLPHAVEVGLGVTFRSLPALLAEADFVSVHVPLTPESLGLIGRDEIALMKRSAFLINTSRGALIDEDALYDALAAGRIAGAGLDVHASEPRGRDDRFLSLPNVVLTPHIGGGSRTVVLPEVEAIFDNIGHALSGRRIPHAAV